MENEKGFYCLQPSFEDEKWFELDWIGRRVEMSSNLPFLILKVKHPAIN